MLSQLTFFNDIPSFSPVSPKIMATFNALEASLIADFVRHDQLFTVGGSDPFWPDGTNLMLKRNHIFYHKRQLEEFNTLYNLLLPEIYFKPTPEPVDGEYQAPNSKSGPYYQFRNYEKPMKL